MSIVDIIIKERSLLPSDLLVELRLRATSVEYAFTERQGPK